MGLDSAETITGAGAADGVKAVLFDLDGTLIDSLADLGEAVNRTLRDLGCPTHPNERYREFIGEGARTLVKRALPAPLDQDEEWVDRALAMYQAHYAACWRDQTRPYEGVMALLNELRQQGVPLGVISNKPQAFTELCVNHFFPDLGFAVVFGQRDAVPRKPDPAAAADAARVIGCETGDCVYVGDSGVDMRFAKAAGMRGVGVTWGFRSEGELSESGAGWLVRSVPELSALLRGWLGES